MRKSIKELIGALRESKAKTEESNRTLSESEARISAIVETAPDGIITIDERGVIESFNPAAESIFGYKVAEIKGLHISILMPCPEHETLNRYWLPVINNLDKKAKEIIGRKKDGSTFFLELSVSETSVGNEPIYTGIVRDITENKRSEQILNDYNFALEEEIDRRTKEVYDALENLTTTQSQLVEADKMATLGNLVAGVAHEINTPIGIGVTLASMLDDLTKQLNAKHKNKQMTRSDLDKYVETVTQSSAMLLSNLNRAAELIHSFKQVAVDQSSDQKRVFLFKAYINDVLNSLHPKLKRTKHRISVTGDETFSMNGNPGVFSQIVANFVVNSLMHGYEQNVNGNINIDFKEEGETLVFKYSDDGKGISEENRKKVFDKFYTTKRGSGGSGLGMHIIHNLVTEKLKGTIRCESELGAGTTFVITLPL